MVFDFFGEIVVFLAWIIIPNNGIKFSKILIYCCIG